MIKTLEIIRPDDWHCHLRDQAFLSRTVKDTSERFHRTVVMPNLKPPIVNCQEASDYRKRILAQSPSSTFDPLMTLYLQADTDPKTLREAKKLDWIIGCKLYPAGVTTHSDQGVQKIQSIYPLLEIMQAIKLPLLIHGEVNDPKVDIFDREARFIEEELKPLLHHFPNLKIVLEHISTQVAVDFVLSGPPTLAATITPQHLLLNRNDLLSGGIKPHYYCLPILKRSSDQEALLKAVTSGNPKFFLGTDSAPHTQAHKESNCGCAGIYSAHAAIEIYAQIFEEQNALTHLENFASVYGAEFYERPINSEKIKLERKPWEVPLSLEFGDQILIPLWAGKTLNWRMAGL